MNANKRIWLLMPMALLPYLVLCSLALVFFSAKNPVCAWIMESLFRGNGLYFVAAVLLYCVFAGMLSLLCVAKSIRQMWDPVFLAKTAVIIKWCQVPAYLLIFVLGVMFAITIFTFPMALILVLLDCVTVFLTGMLTCAAAYIAVRKGVFQTKEVIWVTLLQFVFCADVVAATYFYCKLKQKGANRKY